MKSNLFIVLLIITIFFHIFKPYIFERGGFVVDRPDAPVLPSASTWVCSINSDAATSDTVVASVA